MYLSIMALVFLKDVLWLLKRFFKFLDDNNLTEKIEKLNSEINENNFKEKGKEIQNLFVRGKIPEIASEIEKGLNKLNVQYVSIRSSVVSEDSLKASFAGLHDTFLSVKVELNLVLENVKKCWASLFNERAVVYRIRKEIPHLEGMAVVIQDMIPADVSGTIFTVHPDTEEKNSIVIESSCGLGESIVTGLVTPDRYIVEKKVLTVVRRILGRKKITVKADENGITRIDTPNYKMNVFCLDNATINNLAKISLNIENLYKYPQYIEGVFQITKYGYSNQDQSQIWRWNHD